MTDFYVSDRIMVCNDLECEVRKGCFHAVEHREMFNCEKKCKDKRCEEIETKDKN